MPKRRAILVKSIDGFIDWAWSSDPAFHSHAYFKTIDHPPVEIPGRSLPIRIDPLEGRKGTAEHGRNVWLKEPCVEHTLVSEHYDFSISLLHLSDTPTWTEQLTETEERYF